MLLARSLVIFSLLIPAIDAAASDLLRGPVEARVVRVIDGDTFEAEALVWPGHMVHVNIRIRGIDAPELRGRCETEKQAAREAKAVLARLIAEQAVLVSNIGGDKYYGRVVADVADERGQDVALLLLGLAVVRQYAGGTRVPFCIG
jgi:endonuclease YncB( thermonuclease family)